jgi:dinuclear metal center YbgI/SA1388 family protein
MKTKALIEYLEGAYPPGAAEDWDNVGLLVGDDRGEIHHVFLALDLTEEVLASAIAAGADMILTHHPMIFGAMKKINNHTFTGRKVLSLIQHGMTYYAMHTNYDVLGMGPLSAERLHLKEDQVLSVTDATGEEPVGIGRIGSLPQPMPLRSLAEQVKQAFGLPQVTVYGDLDAVVERTAVCTGSGKSMIDEAIALGAEVYVTGDIDHHTGIDTVAKGLYLIDAGHYGTEYMFMEAMEKELKKAFPELTVSCADVKLPYSVV